MEQFLPRQLHYSDVLNAQELIANVNDNSLLLSHLPECCNGLQPVAIILRLDRTLGGYRITQLV
jgi:hypothetical protein